MHCAKQNIVMTHRSFAHTFVTILRNHGNMSLTFILTKVGSYSLLENKVF